MENKLNRILMFICILFASTLFFDSTLTVSAATIALNTTTSYLVKGETTSLQVTGTSKKVTWTSDIKRVATVTNSGVVKGVGYGTTYIKATVAKKIYKCKIIVINPSKINFTPSRDFIVVDGNPVSLNPQSEEYSTSYIKKLGISYVVSGNPGVTVNNDGQITATEAGNFKITASVHGKKIKTITMKAVVFTGFADAEVYADYAMDVTGASEICALFADGFSVYYDDVKISSKNSKIATATRSETFGKDIDDDRCDGIYVTGIKEGTTTISVTVSGVKKDIKVIVGDGYEKLAPVEAIKKNDFTGYTGNKLATLQKVKQIIDDNNLMSSSVSDRDKIVALQTFFNGNINRNLVIDDGIYNGDISCVLLEGYGYNCCGFYAETFCFLCDCINIPCYYCSGAADNGEGTGFVGHAWNKVEVNSKWYYIDVYWNACLNNFDYFLTEKLWSNHELDELQEIDENGDGVVDEDERENFEMTANDVQQEGYYKDMCGNPGEVLYLNDLD